MLPNFIIVGAAKSGTTSLYHYLNQHPDIFIPERKECRFFSGIKGDFKGLGNEYANDVINSIDEYEMLFESGDSTKFRGDISNDYLYYYKSSIDNIKKHLSTDTKIFIVLRNPVDRAYSNYLHHVRSQWETLSFDEALHEEKSRMQENWSWSWYYKDVGLYAESVKAYMNNFSNVKVLFYDDMVLDIEKFLSEIIDFLGLEQMDINTNEKHNARGKPKNKILHRLIKKESLLSTILRPVVKLLSNRELRDKIKKSLMDLNMNRNIEAIDEAVRVRLVDEYKEDLTQLQKLVKRDLSKWMC